jgi:hypothetical protein
MEQNVPICLMPCSSVVAILGLTSMCYRIPASNEMVEVLEGFGIDGSKAPAKCI